MEPLDLALIELLDHLSRRAAKRNVPAPRKLDRVGDWCSLGAAEENHLRTYLDQTYPGWTERLGRDPYDLSFESLLRALH